MDVSEHREGLAWFYFAGHGLELTSTEQAMVLADFGSGYGPLLRRALTVNNLFYGMAPSARMPDVARTQVYFVDTGPRRTQNSPSTSEGIRPRYSDADIAAIDDGPVL